MSIFKYLIFAAKFLYSPFSLDNYSNCLTSILCTQMSCFRLGKNVEQNATIKQVLGQL